MAHRILVKLGFRGALKVNGMAAAGASYTLATISDGAACSDDTWTATSTTNAPSARAGHTAVWTGSEMIVWGGGTSGPTYLNTGGRYVPSTDSWTATSTTNAPTARYVPTAVWTGSEMIVWGGYNGSYFNTGGRYCGRSPTPTPTATPTPVEASDFTVNGTPASSLVLLNGNTTITFHFNSSPAVQGPNTMHIPAGAFNCGNGPVQDFTCSFFYEVPRLTPTPRPHPTPAPRP